MNVDPLDAKCLIVTTTRCEGFVKWAYDNIKITKGPFEGEILGASMGNNLLSGLRFLQEQQFCDHPEWFNHRTPAPPRSVSKDSHVLGSSFSCR